MVRRRSSTNVLLVSAIIRQQLATYIFIIPYHATRKKRILLRSRMSRKAEATGLTFQSYLFIFPLMTFAKPNEEREREREREIPT